MSPASFNAFFQALCDDNLRGFTLELDVKLREM